MSQPNISAIENDRREPSADTLNRLLVACGYELAAVAGARVVHAPLPRAGWFPDEDLPPRLADDPVDEASTVGLGTTPAERARILTAALAEPRHTVDVDVNVFSPATLIDDVLTVFAGFGMKPEQVRASCRFGPPQRPEPRTEPTSLSPLTSYA